MSKRSRPARLHTVVRTSVAVAAIGTAFVACSSSDLKVVGSWRTIGDNSALRRTLTCQAWTGSELFVWGGSGLGCPGGGFCGDGGLLDPGPGTWRSTATAAAPSARDATFCTWAGDRVFVWGGRADSCPGVQGGNFFMGCNDGALFDPSTNIWMPLPSAPAEILGREFGTVVWTGRLVLIWGGLRNDSSGALTYLGDGARFDPTTNSWSLIAAAGAPTPRARHSAVWTGTRMLIWGGERSGGVVGDGASYDPDGDTWTPVSSVGAPSPRNAHAAGWTGHEMVVLGGASGTDLSDGGRYDPESDGWRRLQAPSSISPSQHLVWTGSAIAAWGFSSDEGWGALFDPSTNVWTRMGALPSGFVTDRVPESWTWTGSGVLLWGGYSAAEPSLAYGDGAVFSPP